jgi:hypothetical protein
LYILSRTLKKLPLILYWKILWRRAFRLTVSNAFFKSMKQAKIYWDQVFFHLCGEKIL